MDYNIKKQFGGVGIGPLVLLPFVTGEEIRSAASHCVIVLLELVWILPFQTEEPTEEIVKWANRALSRGVCTFMGPRTWSILEAPATLQGVSTRILGIDDLVSSSMKGNCMTEYSHAPAQPCQTSTWAATALPLSVNFQP